jgi:hypothetical protein
VIATGTKFVYNATGAELVYITSRDSGRYVLMNEETDEILTCQAFEVHELIP